MSAWDLERTWRIVSVMNILAYQWEIVESLQLFEWLYLTIEHCIAVTGLLKEHFACFHTNKGKSVSNKVGSNQYPVPHFNGRIMILCKHCLLVLFVFVITKTDKYLSCWGEDLRTLTWPDPVESRLMVLVLKAADPSWQDKTSFMAPVSGYSLLSETIWSWSGVTENTGVRGELGDKTGGK